MFGSLTFLLALAQPAAAEEAVEAPPVTLIGDADAVAKKKAPKSNTRPTSAPARGPESPPPAAGARPASPPSGHPTHAPPQPTTRPVDTEHGSGSGARSPGNLRRGAPSASPVSRSAPAESTTHEAADRSSRGSSGHEEADHASRGSSGHEPADGHREADHGRGGHHEAADPVRHAPVRATAVARHREARRGYADHHAAWVARYHPGPWYRPWHPGRPVYWYHGVFVYGPPVVYVDGGHVETRGSGGGGEPAPHRAVNREGKFSLGFTGGSYLSGFHDGTGYGDGGLGITAAYRPIEPLAFQVSWSYHDASWSQGSARVQQPLQLSAELYAFPWSRVSPYVLAGLTMTDRNLDQPLGPGAGFQTEDSLWGPHAGLGIEFALGKSVALDFDARFIGYVNKPVNDPSSAGAVTANMGLNVYF